MALTTVHTPGATPRPAVRRRLARAVFGVGWAGVGFVLLAHLAGVSLAVADRYLLLLVTLLVLGLPHGAVDHLTPSRARGEPATVASVGRVVALYLLLGGGYLIAWFLAPAPAFLFFVLLTWFHWGQGELYPLSALAGAAHLDGRLARAGTVLVRGGLPMLVPLLSFPERYRSVAETVVTLFGADGAWLAWLFGADVRLALGGAFGLVTVATLALGFVRARPAGAGVAGDDTADGSEDAIPGGRRAWALDAGEVGLLWAFFLVVPPVLAIGVYFAVWHSLRHVARLVALDPRATDAVAGGSVVAPALRFARDAAPNTVGALALFATLALAVPGDLGSVASFGGVYLVVLAALTLPHVVIVTELDLTQGILGRRGDGETAPTGG